MSISRFRLDRYIAQHCQISRRDVRQLLAKKRILVDGMVAENIGQIIDKFSLIELDKKILQANQAIYLMMNKPLGVVSATKDKQHKTVIDLIQHPDKETLHIAGRLDLNSTGLLLLTNDSRWSEKLSTPQYQVEKTYRVTLKNKLDLKYITAFEQGMYFEYENIVTRPAKLKIISDYVAQVTLVEGRYHQIKRMFGRFRNPVIALHRASIGNLSLDPLIEFGESRVLNKAEVSNIFPR